MSRAQFASFDRYASHLGLVVAVTPEPQNSDYESGLAQIGNESWHIRTARNTPTKAGAFLAFWRRDSEGQTSPFGDDDAAAGLLVFVEQGVVEQSFVEHSGGRGVFRFTRAHLTELGVTAGKRAGKRGFRVYPAWCTGLNPQAAATKRAQASAFQEY